VDLSRYVIWLPDCQEHHHPLVGGKNTGLGTMMRKGVPVPPGFAITTDAYAAALASTDLDAEIVGLLKPLRPEDPHGIEDASRKIREKIEQTPMPDEITRAVISAYLDLCTTCSSDRIPVAVRSSATAEDLPGASFAGQQDTYLWVSGPDQVAHHVRRCWSSLYTGRAITYRMEMGFGHDQVMMSVCVQKMANSRAAGVMFTLNPINGDRSKVAIDASWGLGEAVAAGEVTPDNYLVDKVTLEVLKKTISPKAVEYRPNLENRSVEKLEIEPERATAPCLSDREVVELARFARTIEHDAGHPLDLEWAVDEDLPAGENILLLQSRPETVWSNRPRESVTEGGMTTMDHIINNLLTGVKIRSAIDD